ncbi:YhcN/YlaJ family sporulation lipoprotein [Bacillus sp. 2205SS5-2]|uniref:YhcN/YlaJ family sporulation lipoprotein n=1 Tax=Bacillus sp. 2205SS5-2 TaxID=3109031 RepID=UPI003FA5AEBB
MLTLKTSMTIAGILSFTILGAGCANNLANDKELYHENGNTINVSDREDIYNRNGDIVPGESANYGYVRHQKSPIEGDTMSSGNLYSLNREEMADIISQLAVTLPKVNDAATLVTDEEVLIAYHTDAKDDKSRFNVADQVKKTALSVIPRWYHVYVTDDTMLMQNVENLAPLDSTSEGSMNQIDDVVNLMLESSPQGRDVETSENPNGEMNTEKKDDDVHSLNLTKYNGAKRYNFTTPDAMN